MYGFSISNLEISKRFFSSCPVLEALDTFGSDIQTDNQRNLVVESPSLKKFAYTCCHRHLLPQNDTMANIIQLFAPNLEDFICRFFLTQDYFVEISCPLSEVYFDMILKEKEEDENADTYSEFPSEKKIVYAKRVVRYLGAVSMVKNMGLSPFFLEVLSQAPNLLDCQPPRLCDLQYLTLEMWSTRASLRAIAYLLNISPNITKIYLCSKTKESNITDVGDDWEAGLSLPGMLSHLKYVSSLKKQKDVMLSSNSWFFS